MSKLAKALTAAAGNAGGESLYVEDVFSTYLYEGNASGQGADAQSITNNIDLSGEGGLVWLKNRDSGGSSAWSHYLFDTERGAAKYLRTNLTSAEAASNNSLSAFNSDGFTLGETAGTNNNGDSYASWTFRKAEKFFDVVTYTGDGVAGREIAHNLGDTPGMIVIKATNSSQNWVVWHNSLSASNKELYLNLTLSEQTGAAFNSTAPTSSVFTVGNNGLCNLSGLTYVAYLFASDAGGFGDDGSENIIKCGSVTTDGSGDATVALGFEPQWVMLKRTDGAGSWAILDTMRGYDHSSSKRLQPNVADAEENYTGTNILGVPTATGFTTSGPVLDANSTYIYIAIRRPMKTPESGTEVFAIDTAVDYSTNPSGKSFDSGFPVDMFLNKEVDQSFNNALYSRLTNKGLRTNTTDSEFSMGGTNWDSNIAVYQTGSTNTNNYGWMFKRATGFFDVVAYTGDGVNPRSITHNLSVIPEMIIIKKRSGEGNWWTWVNGLTDNVTYARNLQLSETDAQASNNVFYKSSDQSSTAFKIGAGFNGANDSSATYIAYLFATLAGVSKVGSYTGTGSNVDVDCGFSAGARFILIKRSDSTGDWYVYDSVRGIVAGNDPYLLLNSTAAEVTSTDYIDPLSSGFTVTSSAPAALNASGGTYIFLAIA